MSDKPPNPHPPGGRLYMVNDYKARTITFYLPHGFENDRDELDIRTDPGWHEARAMTTFADALAFAKKQEPFSMATARIKA